MAFLRKALLFVVRYLWLIAIFVLPWQTRWFWNGPMLDGYAWEQGRLSFYVSLLPMIATIMWAWKIWRGRCSFSPCEGETERGLSLRWSLMGACFLIVSIFSVFPKATLQWWFQILMLVGFGWALIQLRIPVRSLMIGFVVSLFSHAALGIYQYVTQIVIESSWLGMATQYPLTPGVSVVAVGVSRVLRAYGGFPHPNIFGGWLVMGLIVVTQLFQTAKQRLESLAWALIGVLFSVVLVLTFSRSAWLAAAVGLICFFVMPFVIPPIRIGGIHSIFRWIPACAGMTDKGAMDKKRSLFFVALIFLVFAVALYHERAVAFPRFTIDQRLEQQSLSERQIGWSSGWNLFFHHPLVGVGPGATAFALQSQLIPHNVLLLALDELGLIGFIGLAFVFVRWKRQTSMLFFLPLFILCFFDHYFWSLWSGQVLVMIAFVMARQERSILA